MLGSIHRHSNEIADACARHGVARLYAFGSALRGDYRPDESDIDLLVELQPMDLFARVDAYFGLLDELRRLLGANVDLVMVDAVTNEVIAAEIERTRQRLYAA